MPFIRHPVVWISLFFVLLGIGFTYPSVEYISEGIPILEEGKYHNRSGDHLQLYYWFWLIKDNLLGNSALLTNPYEFNTLEGPLDLGFHMFPFSLIYVLFAPLGNITAYNLTIWATFVLTAVFTFLLSREYGIGIWGAIISAVIFTLIPFRIRQITAGHLNGFLFFCFPLVLYCHELLLRNKKLVYGVLSGVAVFALALMEPHLIYYLFFLLGFYVPVRAMSWEPQFIAQPALGTYAEMSAASPSYMQKLFALLIIWLSGIAMVIFYQEIMFGFRASAFWHTGLLGALILYPIIFLTAVLLYSSILCRFIHNSQVITLIRISRTLMPLFLLPVYGFFAGRQILHLGKIWGLIILLVIFFLNFRQFHLDFFKNKPFLSQDSVQALKRLVILHIPLALGMVLSTIYLLSAKLDLLHQSIASGGRQLSDVRLFSPTFQDIWLRSNPNPERFIYLGYIVMLIIGYALYQQIRSTLSDAEQTADSRSIQIHFYLFLFFFSFTLSLGLAFGDVSLYEFCFHHIPFFNYPRVPGRMAIVAFFSASLLSGWTITYILRRSKLVSRPSLAHLLGGIIALGIILEFHPFRLAGINILTSSPLYGTIQRGDGNSRLLEIPLWPGDSHQSSLYEYFSTVDQIPRINGYSPIVPQVFVNEVYNPLYSLNLGRLDREQYAILKALGVEYVTVHTDPDVFPLRVSGNPPLFTIRRFQASPFLERAEMKDGIHLFKVLDSEKINNSEPIVLPLVRIEDGQTIQPVLATPLMDDTINSVVISANPHTTEPGPLTQGPQIYLPGGEYKAEIWLKPSALKKHRSILKLGISTVHKGKATLAIERNVSSAHLATNNGYQHIRLPFSLLQPGYAEFKFWYPQKIGVRIKDVTITTVEENASSSVLEAEFLAGFIGTTVSDPAASGGNSIFVSADNTDRDFMVAGPDLLFPPGTYLGRFSIKAQLKKNISIAEPKSVAELTIVTQRGRHVLAARTVNTHDLDNAKYTSVPLMWHLDRPSRISFRVKPLAGYHVWIDDIRTQPSRPAAMIHNRLLPSTAFSAVSIGEYSVDQLSHTTGRKIFDPEIERKIIDARQGEDVPGYLTYGPYTQFPAGRYQARFHIQVRSSGHPGPMLNLEVANFKHPKVEILSQFTLREENLATTEGYQVFAIPFDSTFAEKLEFRTEYLGVGDIRVSKVELYLHEQRIETETVSSVTGTVHPDPLASGGRALVLSGSKTQTSPGEGWRHALSLAPGNYQLTWRLKPERLNTHAWNSSETVATLQISGPSEALLAQQELTAGHFKDPNYYRIPMRFSVSERTEVTFSLQHQAPAPIWLDSLVLNAVAATPKSLN